MPRSVFKPGQPKPAGSGRKKGTPNKRTLEIVSVLEELKVNPVHALVNLLPSLEAEKQADVYLKLMEYIYPKRKAVEHTGAQGGPIEFASKPATNEDRLKLLAKIRREAE